MDILNIIGKLLMKFPCSVFPASFRGIMSISEIIVTTSGSRSMADELAFGSQVAVKISLSMNTRLVVLPLQNSDTIAVYHRKYP
ncbi:UNVERIFIED_CONTAM: hypothetical protein NCL1_40334 [Trichonephila clavipes]